jgi:hypothetical protein
MTDRSVGVGSALSDDFRDLLIELRQAGAEFLVVGAHALAAHGIARATGDLDVLVRPEPANARRVFLALGRFGAPLAAHGISEADFARPAVVYQLGLPPKRIDVLTSISGVSFDEAWPNRVTRTVDGIEVDFLGLVDLKTNKLASGRPKDLLDLELMMEAGL